MILNKMKRKKFKSYISLKQRITAAFMVAVMLLQICVPTVALAATAWGTQAEFNRQLQLQLESGLFSRVEKTAADEAYEGAYYIYQEPQPTTNLLDFYRDYNQVSDSPVIKMVGDTFVQTRLIRSQIKALLGRFLLQESIAPLTVYAAEAQKINELYVNGKTYGGTGNNKIPMGTPLAANASVAADMIWPEVRTISTSNGDVTVLVPVVHLSQATMESKVDGHDINLFGDTKFAGLTLSEDVLLTGGNNTITGVNGIINNGGNIQALGNITLSSSGTIANLGGVFSATGNLKIVADNFYNKTLVVPYKDKNGEGTKIGRVAKITGASIEVTAADGITFEGASAVSTEGTLTLSAENDINILPVQTGSSGQSQSGHWEINKSTTDLLMSRLAAEDTLSLIAGGVINITASELISTSGGIELLAKNGIHIIDELEQTQIQKVDRKGKTTGTSSEFRTEAVRAILKAGKGVLLDSDFGDVTLRATEITSAGGAQVNAKNGKVHLLMTKELEEFHLQTVRKGTWTIKTRTEDVIHENNIQNAIIGGLEVQAKYGINVEYTGKEGATLKEQIEEFRQIPEMKWMADLYDKALAEAGSKLNWEEVEEIHKEIRKTKTNLSPAAMAIIAIAVAIATGGAGLGMLGAIKTAVISATQGVLGATAAAALGSAMAAGALTLTTQAAQSLAAGNNLRETLNAMDSNESIKSLAVSMVTAGVLPSEGVQVFPVDSGSSVFVSLASQAGNVVIDSALRSGISVSINGGNSKDYLKAFNSALAMSAVNSIGNKLAGKISETSSLGEAGKYIAHAALGCAASSVTEKIQDTDIENACASGAGGAVISQVMADALKADLDQTIADALEGEGSVQSINDQITFLKANGADISRLVSGLFAFALGGDVNSAADAGVRVAQSNAYRYASLVEFNEILNARAEHAPGATFAERKANVYEEDARLHMEENGVPKDIQDSLLQKARDAGIFRSAGQYDAAFTGDGKMYEDLVSKRAQGTYDTNWGDSDWESLNLEVLVVDRPYGDVALSVYNFMGATNKLVNTLTPGERAAVSFLMAAASGGPIKTALVTSAQIGVAKLLPEDMPSLTNFMSRAGIAFTLNRDYQYVVDGYNEAIENPIDIDAVGYGMNEAVDGFGWLIDNISGLRSPITGRNGDPVIRNAYERNEQQPDFTVGPGRIHPVYKSIGDFYSAAQGGSKRVKVMGNYSHYKDGEFIKYNDGKLGEKAMVDVLKGTTGVEFKAIQNLSGHGPDGVYIDRSTNPATIYLAEAKSSVHGADAAKAPTGNATDRLDKWITDYKAGRYDSADSESRNMLRELEMLRRVDTAPVKGIWVQVEVPKFNSSSVEGLDAIINVW